MIQGFNLLTSQKIKNGVQRMYLFTDGHANEGITNELGLLGLVDKFVEGGVTISTFGLGIDFAEVVMRKMAERGSGDYFYIRETSDINEIVTQSMEGLLGLLGTNACFRVHPKQGTVVKKIYGPETASDGYSFGDIVANSERNILVELDITPDEDGMISVGDWELTYTGTDNKKVTMREKIMYNCTKDMLVASACSDNNEVLISVKIKEAGETDRVIKELLMQNQIEKAVEMKKALLKELEELESKDPAGRITKLIELSKKALSFLEEEAEEINVQGPDLNAPSNLRWGGGGGRSPRGGGGGRNPGSGLGQLPPSRQAGGRGRGRAAGQISSAKKVFDSADYVCRNDNSLNWKTQK